MILYKKVFSFIKEKPFSKYIEYLDEINFSPYTRIFDELHEEKKYRAEIVLTLAYGSWGMTNIFNRSLFNQCILEKEESKLIIYASVNFWTFISSVFYLALTIFVITIMVVFLNVKTHLDTLIVGVIIAFVAIVPVISVYFQEISLLNRIGSLGSKTESKEEGI